VGNKHPSGAKGLRVTPGIPDLYCRHRRYGAIWVEVKREGGTFSDAQKWFAHEHDRQFDSTWFYYGAQKPQVFWVYSLDELRSTLRDCGMEPR
jgi:hypothetical protein